MPYSKVIQEQGKNQSFVTKVRNDNAFSKALGLQSNTASQYLQMEHVWNKSEPCEVKT